MILLSSPHSDFWAGVVVIVVVVDIVVVIDIFVVLVAVPLAIC